MRWWWCSEPTVAHTLRCIGAVCCASFHREKGNWNARHNQWCGICLKKKILKIIQCNHCHMCIGRRSLSRCICVLLLTTRFRFYYTFFHPKDILMNKIKHFIKIFFFFLFEHVSASALLSIYNIQCVWQLRYVCVRCTTTTTLAGSSFL